MFKYIKYIGTLVLFLSQLVWSYPNDSSFTQRLTDIIERSCENQEDPESCKSIYFQAFETFLNPQDDYRKLKLRQNTCYRRNSLLSFSVFGPQYPNEDFCESRNMENRPAVIYDCQDIAGSVYATVTSHLPKEEACTTSFLETFSETLNSH